MLGVRAHVRTFLRPPYDGLCDEPSSHKHIQTFHLRRPSFMSRQASTFPLQPEASHQQAHKAPHLVAWSTTSRKPTESQSGTPASSQSTTGLRTCLVVHSFEKARQSACKHINALSKTQLERGRWLCQIGRFTEVLETSSV